MLELILIITLAMLLGNIYQGEIIKKKNRQIKKDYEHMVKCKKEYTRVYNALKNSDLNYLLKQHKATSKRLGDLQGKVCTPNEHIEKTGLEYVRMWLDVRIEEMR